MKKYLLMICALVGLVAGGLAQAQVIKLAGTSVLNANGSVTPTLTWCTEMTASAGATCTNPGPATACTASGDWTGTKGASGTLTLPAVSTTKNYNLQCNWPGQDSFTVTWTPPTTNDDGSNLTDLAGFKIRYTTDPSFATNSTIDVVGGSKASQVVGPGLAPGTYFISMTSYNVSKAESAKAPVPPLQRVLSSGPTVSQAFKVTFPAAPTNVSVQ